VQCDQVFLVSITRRGGQGTTQGLYKIALKIVLRKLCLKRKCNITLSYISYIRSYIRYKISYIRYVRTNNQKSAYATHILENRHEYGTRESTLQLLQACQKGTCMDCWEAFYIQALHQQKILITEQQPANRTHNPQLHTIPTT